MLQHTAMKTNLVILLICLYNCLVSQTAQSELEQCKLFLKHNPTDLESLYKATDLLVYMGGQSDEKTYKLNCYIEAQRLADICYNHHSLAWQSNYAKALAYGALQQISNNSQFKKECAYNVKRWIDESLKINPNHAASWSVLSLWHFKIATQKGVEALFIRDLKNVADCHQAKKHMIHAINLSPFFLPYYLMLSRICIELGEYAEADKHAKHVLLEAGKQKDSFIVKKSHEILSQIKTKK